MSASDFARGFAAAYSAHDPEAIARLFFDQSSFHCLSGALAEGPAQITQTLQEEFLGLSQGARLVTGKSQVTQLSPHLCLLHQRFVVSGLRDETGQELPRIAALFTAVLQKGVSNWRALSASLSPLDE